MNYVEHRFGTNETIEGVIRLHNSHAMSDKVAKVFMQFYNTKNGQVVPKVGDLVFIPVDERIAKLKL